MMALKKTQLGKIWIITFLQLVNIVDDNEYHS